MSHVLVERQVGATGLDRMLGWSAVAHLLLLAIVALVPAGWLGARAADQNRNVMTITLSGTVGPRTGGLTPIGARPVQTERPVEDKKAIEPVRPPAAAEPEMIEPVKVAPKKQEAPVKTKAPDAKSRTPTQGEEIRKGTATAETTARGKGFGLTTGGGGGTGATLDVGDFCCPEYISTMQELINRNWTSKGQGEGTTIMKFVIERDGRITAIQREKSSGQVGLDFQSERALMLTKLPPLPGAYSLPSLTVHLSFEYQR